MKTGTEAVLVRMRCRNHDPIVACEAVCALRLGDFYSNRPRSASTQKQLNTLRNDSKITPQRHLATAALLGATIRAC